jgi:hypothetical protein
MNDRKLTFGGVEPGTSTLAAYIKHMEYVDRTMATAQADMERVNIFTIGKMNEEGYDVSKTIGPMFDNYSCEFFVGPRGRFYSKSREQ